MAEEYYKEININGITPGLFPSVALYLKTGTNYILYLPHGRALTKDDYERLKRRGVDYISVRTGDMEEISTYLEKYLTELLQRTDLNSLTKSKILFQACVDYVADILANPRKVKDVERCRILIRPLMQFVAHDKDALIALRVVVDRAPYLIAHSVLVAAFTLLVHSQLFPSIKGAELEDVGIGAILHDLGMSFEDFIPAGKAGSFSDQEYQLVKLHTNLGYDYLNRTKLFSDTTLDVVHHHHERYDGRGYPTHLCGEEIPIAAQVAALCDSFCAMTSDRVYRKAFTTTHALQTMNKLNGAHETSMLKDFVNIVTERHVVKLRMTTL